jgi:2Fe-2S ferredoxin
MMDVLIKIKDRDGVVHELQAPTDMAMNIMELCKAYELPWKERAEEWLCVLLANVMCLMMFHCQKWDEEAMLSEAFYVKSNSRLSIPITKILEGLELELAQKIKKSVTCKCDAFLILCPC